MKTGHICFPSVSIRNVFLRPLSRCDYTVNYCPRKETSRVNDVIQYCFRILFYRQLPYGIDLNLRQHFEILGSFSYNVHNQNVSPIELVPGIQQILCLYLLSKLCYVWTLEFSQPACWIVKTVACTTMCRGVGAEQGHCVVQFLGQGIIQIPGKQ